MILKGQEALLKCTEVFGNNRLPVMYIKSHKVTACCATIGPTTRLEHRMKLNLQIELRSNFISMILIEKSVIDNTFVTCYCGKE